MARHNEIGKIGEDIATKWLSGRGYEIVERNYLKKFGEIDIVARETLGTTHFIEVKTVSYGTKADLEYAVSHETWRPEENVHNDKIGRLKRTIETWIIEHNLEDNWVIDIITVRLVTKDKFAKIKLIENVIFE